MPLDSQYGLCFRMCLYDLIKRLTAERGRHKLHVVIEVGHKNVRDTGRIFNEVKADFEAVGRHILGTITIAKKSECLEPMIADFQAHMSSISEARVRAGLPGYFDMSRGELPKRGEARLTQIEFMPETFRSVCRSPRYQIPEGVADYMSGHGGNGSEGRCYGEYRDAMVAAIGMCGGSGFLDSRIS
jgi:hypothetical protein